MVKRLYDQEDSSSSNAIRRRVDEPGPSSTNSSENNAEDVFSSLWNSGISEATRSAQDVDTLPEPQADAEAEPTDEPLHEPPLSCPDNTQSTTVSDPKVDTDYLSDNSDAIGDTSASSSSDGDSDDDFSAPPGSAKRVDSSFDEYSSDSESTASDSDNDDDVDPVLYQSAPISLNDSMLSVLTLALTHNLSGRCVNDILQLVAIHCPSPNLCKRTFRVFKKHFAKSKSLVAPNYYCTSCFESLGSKESVCAHCNQRRGVGYFVDISIISQLEALLKRQGFRNLLKHRFVRNKLTLNNYEDIYDGNVYKSLSSRGNILVDSNNVSFTWHTGAVRLFKSSKTEFYPFYLSINELPFSERLKIENVMLAGIWIGSHKPVPKLFLKRVREDLHELNRGVHFKVPDSIDPVLVRGVVICGTCDLQSKSIFLNMSQHRSTFGCQKCKVRTVIENNKTVYKFQRYPQMRNYQETLKYAQKAIRLRKSVYGVKGPSALTFVYHPIETTVIDMHDAYLGICKILNEVHFSEVHKQHPASLYGFLELYDRRLCSLRPPHYVQGLPRSLQEFGKLWEASELKTNLMIYSLPLLQDIMSLYHFEHHMLLVYGLYLLSKDTVSEKCIELASEVLTDYCSRFEDLYGSAFMSCHVHQLIHLPSVVRDFGPLWVTSCAPYDSLNWTLKKFIQGNQDEESQINSAASLFLNVSKLKSSKPNNGRPAQVYCERLTKGKKKLELHLISGNIYAVGKYRRTPVLPEVVYVAIAPLQLTGQNFYLFDRVLNTRKNMLFSSETHDEASKHYSACVKYRKPCGASFGIIKTFFRVTDCECDELCESCDPSFYAIIQKFHVQSAYRAEPGGFIPYIHRCADTNEYEAIKVECLTYVCFFIFVDDRHDMLIVEPISTSKVE